MFLEFVDMCVLIMFIVDELLCDHKITCLDGFLRFISVLTRVCVCVSRCKSIAISVWSFGCIFYYQCWIRM